jgi:hypothetical protein
MAVGAWLGAAAVCVWIPAKKEKKATTAMCVVAPRVIPRLNASTVIWTTSLSPHRDQPDAGLVALTEKFPPAKRPGRIGLDRCGPEAVLRFVGWLCVY